MVFFGTQARPVRYVAVRDSDAPGKLSSIIVSGLEGCEVRGVIVLLCIVCIALATSAVADDWRQHAFQSGQAGSSSPSKSSSRPSPSQGNSGATTTKAAAQAEPDQAQLTKEKAEKAAAEELKKLRPDLKPANGQWVWKVLKAAWAHEDEDGYGEFIRTIGESECTTGHDCLTSPVANPKFHTKHPPRMTFFADCADLPFVLRGYYAWQNGLPFSFSVRLQGHPRTPGHKSRLYGRQVIDRYDIVGPGPDPRSALPAINQFVSSEHFRTPPAYQGKLLADHYPVRISREGIRPGTVVFDPEGHIAIVFKVTDDGRIHYIDAHPDNSLTRGIFNREFGRAEPPMGAGFKRWRPQRLVGAKSGPNGTLVGGTVSLARDSELSDWSDEQFFGNRLPRPALWDDGEFVLNDQIVDYHDYVRLRLAFPGFKYNPIDETRSMLRQICRDLKYRVDSVNLAIKAGINRRPQPDKLPKNIYATQGDWETYSTPSRDARIRTAIEELKDEIARFLDLSASNSQILDYAGNDMRQDLLTVYKEETAACSITYTKSDGEPKLLSYAEIMRRLFNLSFDPYHCVERRWGADDPDELRSCGDDPLKTAWYFAEARLRNQLVRTYGEPMGWNLAELQKLELDIGIKERPEVDAMRVLAHAGSPNVRRSRQPPTGGGTAAARR